MDLREALDIVVARTRHERYRALCDPAHPDYNPAVADYVLRRAAKLEQETAGQEQPQARSTSVAESLELNRRMQLCPWRQGETSCGCGGLARCAIGNGKAGLVNHQDCYACLRSEEAARVATRPAAAMGAVAPEIALPATARRSVRVRGRLWLGSSR